MAKFTRGFTGRGKAERDPRLPPGQYDTGKQWPVWAEIDATCERLRAFGCAITGEPDVALEMPMRIVMAQDPDGYGLELIEQPAS